MSLDSPEVKTSLSKNRKVSAMSGLFTAVTPQAVRIQCINKTDRMNPHERIKNVGGLNDDGTPWRLPLEAAIAGVKSFKWRFWVSVDNDSVLVVVAKSAQGNEYLKTEADGDQPNNLLSLPECP